MNHVEFRAANPDAVEDMRQQHQQQHCARAGIQPEDCPGSSAAQGHVGRRQLLQARATASAVASGRLDPVFASGGEEDDGEAGAKHKLAALEAENQWCAPHTPMPRVR